MKHDISQYSNLRLGVLGSHSALEIMDGAKDENFKTVVYCQKGRDVPYRRFKRIADEIYVLDKFSDMLNIQYEMLATQTLIVPHRSLVAYLGYDSIENDFKIPIFGNRTLFRAEERNNVKGQYYLLRKAGILHPRIFNNYKDIDCPVIVKVQEKTRKLERAFFTANSVSDFEKKSRLLIDQGRITAQDLDKSKIEEFVLGTYMNFNFFYTPISNQVDFIGIERRLQTDLNDYISLPAKQQLDFNIEPQNIEVGHTPASIRESLLEKVFKMGDDFVTAVKKEYPPGIIGPFSLQSVITKDLKFVVYDVSLRVPGNPIVSTTSPYTKYQYGETFGVGRRIAMEIRRAVSEDKLEKIIT